jgi:hypothetical protein
MVGLSKEGCLQDHSVLIFPEMVSKPQIMFESKACGGLKTERTRKYVNISIRGTTQLPDIRWGFEAISR